MYNLHPPPPPPPPVYKQLQDFLWWNEQTISSLQKNVFCFITTMVLSYHTGEGIMRKWTVWYMQLNILDFLAWRWNMIFIYLIDRAFLGLMVLEMHVFLDLQVLEMPIQEKVLCASGQYDTCNWISWIFLHEDEIWFSYIL